jgi:hypothetical protein
MLMNYSHQRFYGRRGNQVLRRVENVSLWLDRGLWRPVTGNGRMVLQIGRKRVVAQNKAHEMTCADLCNRGPLGAMQLPPAWRVRSPSGLGVVEVVGSVDGGAGLVQLVTEPVLDLVCRL